MEITSYAELESDTDDVVNESNIRPVSSQPNDWTISALRDKHDRGQIDLQPHYQREYVWELKPELPSRLIESLLLQIPVPPLYFVRLQNGRLEVVDGQQRLTTLIRFVKNEFALQKLQKLTSLNGKLFRDLSIQEQEKILDATIRSIVIDAGNNHELRYEIFERLNRGAMALNEQEIRNCVYRGPFCDLLAELEKDQIWRRVKGTPTAEPRFLEREMILRFFTLAHRIDYYTGNLKQALNEYMGKYVPNEASKIAELAGLFRQTMQNVYMVFGENSGRLYSIDEDKQINDGKWDRKFSISALDIQAGSLLGHSLSKVQSAAQQIREAYIFYLITNPQVRLAISKRPANRDATRTRWFGFKTVVQEILNNPSGTLYANDPLYEAKALFRANYINAAGAIAGVVLERHLKGLCEIQNPPIVARGDTINPLNDALRNAQVYDLTQQRRIQVMADIRNRCDHATSTPPRKEEVWEMIEDIRKFIKDYPLN
jgi:hypothetical protein